MNIIVKATGVCARLKERSDNATLDSPGKPSQMDTDVVQEASVIDQELEEWASGLPQDWLLTKMDHINHIHRPEWSKTLLSIPGGPTHMRIYSSLLTASDWNMYRSVRIHIWLLILAMASRFSIPSDGISALVPRGISLLLELSVEIAETVPYSIGLSLDGSQDPKSPDKVPGLCAYKVFWSVYKGFLSHQNPLMKDYAYLQRAAWFGYMLRFLKDTIGISKADVWLEG